MKIRRKALIAIMLVLCCCAASFAAAGFSDVAANHWGLSYIERAKAAGIIDGYPSGVFKPENSVSKQESATMLYRTLSYAGLLKGEEDFSESFANELSSAGIDSWANLYCSYAFSEGIISSSDFTKSKAPSPAPRAMIAKWASKAMGYELSPLSVLPYSDTGSIDAGDFSYVDALYRHSIMRGNANGTFKPLDGVKRVELAAVVTRMIDDKDVDYSKLSDVLVSKYGTVTSVNEDRRTVVLNSGGTSYTLRIADDAAVILDGSSASMSSLAALKGKNASFSCVIGAANSVIVQTTPSVCSGTVSSITHMSGYDVITVASGSYTASFAADAESDVRSLSEGAAIKYISDGAYLLEAR